MAKTKRVCLQCESEFMAENKEINRGYGKFCSSSCSIKFNQRKPRTVTLNCAYCGDIFTKPISRIKKSKSGFHFCTRKCKDMAQRLDGLTEIQPPHYGTGDGSYKYRETAFEYYSHQCNRCGYDKFEAVLVVHHKDRNRGNNEISNLEILCCNCHKEEHLRKTKTAKLQEML